ncbi:MAG TPA: MBL fold metallo-hydrolase [Solirubrobacteraceae bacterium]|nr:MBL fold metallo-hydrolase [Solirubrobacteraceae bacterium]
MAEFEAIFVDVGQGDCTLIKLPDGEYMLVDVCRCPGHGIDVFKLLDAVLPDNGDGRLRLKWLVISHAHDDHITGIGDLYDRYAVEWLWVPQHEDRKQIARHFADYHRVVDEHPGDRVLRPQGSRTPLNEMDEDGYDLGEEVTVRCFSPPGYIEIDETLTEEEAKRAAHENCLVIKIDYRGASVLLTGDSDLACWQRVVDYYEGRTDEQTGTEVLEATVLHASHHGSRTFFKDGGEDAEGWLTALELINPSAVVVSVGENNRHEHPHEDMMDAYRDQAGEDNVYETSQTGTVILEVEDDGVPRLRLDSGAFAEDYGWDDDDDDDGSDEDRDGGGGGAAKLAAGVVAAGALTAAAVAARRRRGSPTRLDDQPAA